jgi:hydrogenase maturation factor
MRYAFPCARVLVDFRKTLTEEQYSEMQKAVETDTPMDRAFLEEKFHKAFSGMKKISADVWNIETIREYFCVRHEDHLSSDLPDIVNRMCVVKPGKLVKMFEKEGKRFFRAEIGEGDVRVVIPLYKDAAVGDTAMIHYGYAVEKVDGD